MANIIIGKYGQKIEFVDSLACLNVSGGKIEIMNTIMLLAKHNPNDTFWIISRSNSHELPQYQYNNMFPNKNVRCVYEKNLLKKHGCHTHVAMDNIDVVERVLVGENVNPTAAIIFPGIGLTSVILPGMPKVDGDGDVNLSDTALYGVTSIVQYLNKYHENMKIIDLCTDPNYTTWKQAKDILYHVDHYYAQYSYAGTKRMYTNRKAREFTTQPIQIEYAALHESYMYNKQLIDVDINNKTNLFTIVLNEGQKSRYNMLNEWVLSNKAFNDIAIYGKWIHPSALADSRFKGTISYGEVESVLNKTRATFIVPIEPGWVTLKYLEMLRNGTIPFFHPSYDAHQHLNTPPWMRPRSQSELLATLDKLRDDAVYLSMLDEARSMLYIDTECLNLNSFIMNSLTSDYVLPDTNLSVKKPVKSLLDFFN